jgi:hypothetical protein
MEIEISSCEHLMYVSEIQQEMYDSAQRRGTGIAKRSIEYLSKRFQKAMLWWPLKRVGRFLLYRNLVAWEVCCQFGTDCFSRIQNGEWHSIKHKVFQLSREKYPNAKIFGLTTGLR